MENTAQKAVYHKTQLEHKGTAVHENTPEAVLLDVLYRKSIKVFNKAK